MIIFKSINKLNKEVNFKAKVGFVPTMGSLHKGHISLIKSSRKKCQKTLVSIFVNPTQFNNKNDYKNYPRNLKKDINLLRKLKVDYLLIPKSEDIYKNKNKMKIKISKTDKIMCAIYRPGHFEGVLAVINQFLIRLKPKYIFFGKKDYQQLYLVRKYIRKKFKTKVVPCSTIRDKNMVALSSRNSFLNSEDIKKSSILAKKIIKFKKKIIKNIMLRKNTKNIIFQLNKLKNIKIEYLEVRNEKNLSKKITNKNFKIFVAYYNKNVRIIDNF